MRLKSGQSISTSILASLNSILDYTGLIGIGGRLRNEDLKFEVWKRWEEKYLNTRQQRYKRKTSSLNLQTAAFALVLLKNGSGILESWFLGRVNEVYTGKDNLVLSAKIHTSRGDMTRAVQQIVPLLNIFQETVSLDDP